MNLQHYLFNIIGNTLMMVYLMLVAMELHHEVKQRAILIGRSEFTTKWFMLCINIIFLLVCLSNLLITSKYLLK